MRDARLGHAQVSLPTEGVVSWGAGVGAAVSVGKRSGGAREEERRDGRRGNMGDVGGSIGQGGREKRKHEK